MPSSSLTSLAELTTIRVGGPAASFVEPDTREALLDAVRAAWASGDEWLILGGGSNVLIADEGFDGQVIRVGTRGIESEVADGQVRLRVQAGESWDAVVALAVANGWIGIEALSGIPGSVGAAPIQNIGAYGQELSHALVAIEFLDYLTGELVMLDAAALDLDYRTSAIKQGRHGLVVSVELSLAESVDEMSAPVAYEQLASALGVAVGARAPLVDVRTTVHQLRASKGMIVGTGDADSVSCGSFFTNPIVSENFARGLPTELPRWPIEPEQADFAMPLGSEPAPPPRSKDFRVKLSAAWLIERAGIARGFSLPGSRAAISSKHTLAIVNRGGATATEISSLARFIQTRVYSEFGVRLQPEPVFVGVEL